MSSQTTVEELRDQEAATAAYFWLLCELAIASVKFRTAKAVLATLPPLGAVFKEFQKITRICRAAENLIKNFSGQGVLVTQQIDVPENGTVDLFVRFPNPPKAVFLVGLRSNGESKVFFNEAKEALYFQRKRGGLRAWQVDLFRRFALQEFWLRKNRQDLFGQSSRDKNRAAVKLLVLTGETKLGQHSEHLYTEIGGQKVLCVRNRISLYIMEEHQLVPFIQGWLNH